MTARRNHLMHGVGLAAGLILIACTTGCLSASPRAIAVWIVGGDEQLTHDTPPKPENDAYSASRGRVRLRAALNETLGLQVGLRTTAPPAGPFDVRVTDLVGSTDTLRARSTISIYRVHYTRVDRFPSWYPTHTGKPTTPTLFPDILVPWNAPRGGGPLLLTESRNEIVWIDVRVPPTVAPGEYRGRIEVSREGAGSPVFASEIVLEVLPVALAGEPSLPVVCRVDPRDMLTAHLRWPRLPAEQTRLLPDVPSHFAAVRLVQAMMQMLHEHRATPVLWASFPKLRLVGDRRVEVQWDEYDRLVEGWLSGSAFPDQVRLDAWPIPASLDYPNVERNGGFESPRYARLLAAYLAECKRHFAERGWLDRAFVRACPPEPLSQDAVNRVRRLAAIVRQSEADLPVVVHLPARSLRGLGWHGAPTIDLPAVSTWAPPAMWYEPEAMARERSLGRETWLMPSSPPYSGSLAVVATPVDARILAWQAYRYGVQALWIEHATEFGTSPPTSSTQRPWVDAGLLYPAHEYGLRDRPAGSLRLKRLRRGLQDYELLRLLEQNGKHLLAQQLSEQVVRWSGTDACEENLLTGKEGGWPQDPSVLRLAREVMLQELAGEFEPSPEARQRQVRSLSQWGLLMTQARRVSVAVGGVRLSPTAQGMRAEVLATVRNTTNRPLQGTWTLPSPPTGWRQSEEVLTNLQPGTRRPARIELELSGLAYNVDGVYPFDLQLDTPAAGSFRTRARLAVAACPIVKLPPHIDGKLDDWPLASNNAAGDFRLCREMLSASTDRADQPSLPTQAFFSMDATHLYIGVRCTLAMAEPPLWNADNTIPVDGAIPWGQDVVEILIDPRENASGTSSDLYCLQTKPSGLLLARRGCRTEPPMGTWQTWPVRARAAASVEREAWVVEMAVPLSAFGADAKRNPVWGMNVTRLDARRGEYSSWSGATGHCYSPQSLGNLIMLWP